MVAVVLARKGVQIVMNIITIMIIIIITVMIIISITIIVIVQTTCSKAKHC